MHCTTLVRLCCFDSCNIMLSMALPQLGCHKAAEIFQLHYHLMGPLSSSCMLSAVDRKVVMRHDCKCSSLNRLLGGSAVRWWR